MKHYAVLTGDVNASSRMSTDELRGLEPLLQACFQDTCACFPKAGVKHFSCFRGDSWQFVLETPCLAGQVAVCFRAALLLRSSKSMERRLQSAVAIGFGGIDFFPDAPSTTGSGEAYTNSGHTLDRMRRRMPGMSAAGLQHADAALASILGLLDALARQWTAPRARAVLLALRGLRQEEIAASWQPEPVTQQAVHKHLQNAGWPAIEPALQWMQACIRSELATINNHNEL